MRSFLGLTNYFRKFVKGYSPMTAPLSNLLRKNVPWLWSDSCQEAFDDLKTALTSAPVLALPKAGVPFEVISDASGFGLGAILQQDGRPVAFESRKLLPAEENYTTTEQELLGVVHALKVWRCYLEGEEEFTVFTDHKANTFLDVQPSLSIRQTRWAEFLSRFHIKWTFKGLTILLILSAEILLSNPVPLSLGSSPRQLC